MINAFEKTKKSIKKIKKRRKIKKNRIKIAL